MPERRPGARDSMSARRDGPTGSRAKARRRPAGSRQEAAARYCGRIYSLRFRPTELKRRMSATGGRIPSVSKPEPLKEWRLSFKGECGIRRESAPPDSQGESGGSSRQGERQRRSSRRAHFPRPGGSRQGCRRPEGESHILHKSGGCLMTAPFLLSENVGFEGKPQACQSADPERAIQ